MSIPKKYDVIIVGSGATGGWAAKELTENGLEVLVIEAGPMVEPSELNFDKWTAEKRKAASVKQPIQSQHPMYWFSNPSLFVDDEKCSYTTSKENPFSWIRGRQFGGRTLTWGGATLRFTDFEFKNPELGGYDLKWPISYKDLEPFYSKVEKFLNVQEGQLTETEQRFKLAVEKKFSDRKVVSCRGIPLKSIGTSPWPAKTSVGTTLHAALQTGRLTIKSNSIVTELVQDSKTSKIKFARGIDQNTKEPFECEGRVVILAASTVESIRLMLNSGVGNSSGLLGCYLSDHLAANFMGPIPELGKSPQLDVFGGPHSFNIHRFRNLRGERSQFIGGYGMWGVMQRGYLLENGMAWFLLSSILEVIPRKENRVSLDSYKRDFWGLKAPKIIFNKTENEISMIKDATSSMLEMLNEAGLKPDSSTPQVSGSGQYVHELGGATMGIDPKKSVLSSFNQCWDSKNLFVIDGSCFVSAGWQNPTHTMMAIAVRACDYILKELKALNL